jgi:hypothetical protein
LRHKERGADHVIVGCRTRVVRPNGQFVRVTPRRLPSRNESLPDYIFVRHGLQPDTAIGSSMLLFDRSLADVVPFSSRLPIHQDWDWVIAAQREADIEIEYSPEVLLRYTYSPLGTSVSSSSNWKVSAQWFQDHRNHLTPREYADGLLGVTAHLAAQQRDWPGVFGLLRTALKDGRPGFHALAFAVLFTARSLLSTILAPSALNSRR